MKIIYVQYSFILDNFKMWILYLKMLTSELPSFSNQYIIHCIKLEILLIISRISSLIIMKCNSIINLPQLL